MDENQGKLKERYSRYVTYYGNLKTEMDAAKKQYNLDFKIKKPKNTLKRLPPTGQDLVDVAVAELITNEPKAHRHREHHSEAGKKHDDNIEQALQGFLLDAEEYLRTPALHEAGKFQLVRGATTFGGPFYTEKDNTAWFDVYDPATTLLEPGGAPREAFMFVKMTIAELEQLAAEHERFEKFNAQGKTSTETTTLVQWWSWDPKTDMNSDGQRESGRYASWVEDQGSFITEPQDSGYPYLPLDMVASGWGIRALGALPEETYVSLLNRGVRDMLVAEAEAFTMLQADALKTVWGRHKVPPGIVLPQGFDISTEPNSITYDWPVELVPIEDQPMRPEVAASLERARSYVEKGTHSRILGGERQPGVGTASGYQLLTGRARKRYEAPVRMLQGGVARLLLRLGWLVEFLSRHEEEFKLSWRGVDLTNKMYDGDYTVEVDLQAEDDEERRLKIASGEAQKDILSERERYEDFAGRENFSASRVERMVDAYVLSPAFQEEVMDMVRMRLKRRSDERSAKRTDGQTPQGENDTMNRFAQGVRAARVGQAPAQPGTIEGAAQTQGQPVIGGMPRA